MDVETQKNELVCENVRECYRGNEDRIYGFPSVCVRRMLESLSHWAPGREQTKQERNVWRDVVPDVRTP
jgi:hypothetical protein